MNIMNTTNCIDNDFVFIMTRHVNSEITNNYWIESCKCIRQFYPEIKIIIIDDNSNYNFVSSTEKFINVEIIKSEYQQRGELLPYYYFFKNKCAKKAIVIHDSLFIQNKIDIDKIDKVKFFWHHYHTWNDIVGEKTLIKYLNNSDNLLKLYDMQEKWALSVGVMSVINYDFLCILEYKYNFFNLLHFIKNRTDRMCLERIFGLICHYEYPELINDPSLFSIQTKTFSFNQLNFKKYPIFKDDNHPIKVRTGR